MLTELRSTFLFGLAIGAIVVVSTGPFAWALDPATAATSAAPATTQASDGRNAWEFPTLVTLKLNDSTAVDAFDALQQASGVRFRPQYLDRIQDRRVTVNFSNEPFLLALQEICRQAGVTAHDWMDRSIALAPAPRREDGSGKIRFGPGSWIPAKGTVHGAFLVVATHLKRDTRLEFGEPEQPASVSLNVVVVSEPKVDVHGVSRGLIIEEAMDEMERSVKVNTQGAARGVPRLGSRSEGVIGVSAPIRMLPGAQRLVTLRGSIGLFVVASGARVDFADVADAKVASEQFVNGVRCQLKPLVEWENGYDVEFHVFRDGRDDASWQEIRQKIQAGHETFKLTDAEGRRLPLGTHRVEMSGGQSNDASSSAIARLRFRRERTGGVTPGMPRQFIWEYPTTLREVIVPIELTDVPLR